MLPTQRGVHILKLAIGYTTGACKTGAAEHGTLQQIVAAYKRHAETGLDRQIGTHHRGVVSDIQVTYAATGPGCVRLGLQHMPQQTLTEIRTYHRGVLCGVQLTYAATDPDGKIRDWKPWPP